MSVPKSRRFVDDMSGFCRNPGRDDHGHRHCSWGEGIETPSAVIRCVCPCHVKARVIVPKGQASGQASGRVLVPKQ